MQIKELMVMQYGLRESVPLDKMIEFVRDGGIYTPEAIQHHMDKLQLIGLTRFEDGKVGIHDGHHRIASIWLSGKRDCLDEREYFIKDLTYAGYMKPNFEIGWVTPFDPRTEVRLADFGDFKKRWMDWYVFQKTVFRPTFTVEDVSAIKHEYCRPRPDGYDNMDDLCQRLGV